ALLAARPTLQLSLIHFPPPPPAPPARRLSESPPASSHGSGGVHGDALRLRSCTPKHLNFQPQLYPPGPIRVT
uniref:Uncharacterized protein n=1 Tax=Aegilops tauschii subsp. strangulata TaxID=200361 RepID=A0A453GW97_AEGTS